LTGLFNGALGTVIAIKYEGSVPVFTSRPAAKDAIKLRQNPIVFVKMDNFKGQSCYQDIPNVVPFCQIQSRSKLRNRYYRYQLPLSIAHCSTVHKYQGLTAKNALILYPPDPRSRFPRGLVYVMTSRPTRMEDIYLMSPLHFNHFNKPGDHRIKFDMIKAEYERLERKFLTTTTR